MCDDLAACCDASGQSFDREACVAAKSAATLERVGREEERSLRSFDAGMAAACVARLEETPASCGGVSGIRECSRIYEGTVELGEACSAKSQCRGSLRGDVACIGGRCTTRLATGESCEGAPAGAGCDVCRPEARCQPGEDGAHRCHKKEGRRGVAGDACSNGPPSADPSVPALASCAPADGLYCSSEGVCTAYEVGDACRLFFECGPGKRCVDATCMPGLAEGEECRSSFGACGEGLYCEWTEYVCTERAPSGACVSHDLISGRCALPSAEGEPCGRFTDCGEGLVCDRAPDSDDGVCITTQENLCTTGLERLTRQSNRLGL